MITNIEISTQHLRIGESITIQPFGDSPLVVTIGCFVDQPPPPRFTGCAECDVHRIQSGESITFRADPETWHLKTGSYRITITDASDDRQEITIPVSRHRGFDYLSDQFGEQQRYDTGEQGGGATMSM